MASTRSDHDRPTAASGGADAGTERGGGSEKQSVLLSSQGSRALGAALTAAIAVGGLAYGGSVLDRRWGVSPLFVLLGTAVGGLGGFLYLVKEIMPDALPWTRSETPGAAAGSGTPGREEPDVSGAGDPGSGDRDGSDPIRGDSGPRSTTAGGDTANEVRDGEADR